MVRYLYRRILQALLSLAILATVVFFLGRSTGNPAVLILGPEATLDEIDRLTKALGFDRPLYVQFGNYIADLLRGDFGESTRFRDSALSVYFERLGRTLELTGFAFALSVGLAIVLGVMAAAYRNRWPDKAARLVAVLGLSVPNFWLGLILSLIFAVKLGWLPASRYESWQSLILPAITLSSFGLAAMTRLLRSSMVEVLGSEFILFNRAKGVPERSIVWKHGLRNGILPLLTYAGMYIALLVSGSIVVETVFAFPGVGQLSYQALVARDFSLIQAITLVTGAIIVLLSFITDIIYSLVDPRIKLQ